MENDVPQTSPQQPPVAQPDVPAGASVGAPVEPLKTIPPAKVPKKFYIQARYLYGAAVVLLVALISGAAFYFLNETHTPVKQFTNVYSFVPEKISKSAAIQINVPAGIDEDTARKSISFSPEIEGTWATEELADVIIFEPKKPMRSGVYYAVNMDTGSVQMSGDFYVDEDPRIEAIFPASGSEAHEDSEITIVFNRPMVPLTTLLNQEDVELPIVIKPETPGRYKWISTRNLQFIPESTLIPSSEYTVEIKNGLYSLDGLSIAPVTHTFITRPLRYEYVSADFVGYRAPIIVDFNQAVDLEATKRKISVTKQGGGTVGIDVEYGENTYYDRAARKYITETDPTKLFVYQKKDSHGRSRLWDFDTRYEVQIEGGVPLFGTEELTEGMHTTVSVPNIVEAFSAQSERSTLVRSDVLDTQGTLTVTFYEDVDKDKSDIKVKGLRDIVYGERCKTDEHGEEIIVGSSCEKEDDKKTLIFSFNHDAFSRNESFALELKKVVTPEGFRINAKQLDIPLRTYPELSILRTVPQGQGINAPVDGMYVCSNTPLQAPGEGGLSEYVQASGYIVHGRWSSSEYVETTNTYNTCRGGEFETHLKYGLLPQTDYTMTLSLTDAFGQKSTEQLSFKTGAPKEQYTRFHNMQQQYNVTPSNRTKLTYAVENLEYVDMHICRMEPEVFLEKSTQRPSRFTPADSDGCTQVVTQKITLPARYWVNNYFQVNLAEHFTDPRGHYILTFTNPLYKETYENKQLYDRTYVSVTNLAVGKKEVARDEEGWSMSTNPDKEKVLDAMLANERNLYWVSNSSTLSPVIGASVTQYEGGYQKDFIRRSSGVTDGQGVARVGIDKSVVGAVIRAGSDSAVVSDWADVLRGAGAARDSSRTYVYTDRPIYRPGHTVSIRGIDRVGFDGEYEIIKTQKVPLEIFDSQGNRVYETLLDQSPYGTFSTTFDLPSDAPLGSYYIEVFGQSSRFDVEEYVPAAFKLEATANQEEYINGETLKLEVQADYYFGVPLSDGTVTYSVTAQDYYFDRYTDEYFNFGSGWYECYSCGYGDNFLFRGETTFNEQGRATFERALDFDEFFDEPESEGSKLVTVSITAQDINGRSVSMQKSFIVHKGDYYIGAKTDTYYTSVNTPINLRVKTVDTKGQSVSVSNIERVLYEVVWETFKRQEVDGGFYYRTEKKLTEVGRERLKTDASGNWNGPLSFAKEGQYEIHVFKADDNGNMIKTVSNVYIYGTERVTVPPNNNYELDLEVEKTDLEVGDTASVLIKSPYERAKVLISVERGSIYDYTIVDVTGGLYLYEFPIKDTYAPNVFVSALLLSGDPEVKYGSVRFDIGSKEHELDVQVTANKTHYLPGEEVVLSVETKDAQGRLVPAEVSIAVADLSVLALKGNPKKNPVMFFFDGFPLAVTTASNIKNILYEVGIPLGTKGGGGASPDDLATKKRGLFKDTAFWAASIVTNQNGKATVTFTLPDNLTTWQVESLGVTQDTKLGVDYGEFTTKKDLMATPLKPRFIVPGDTFSLGAQVFNQTEDARTVAVSLQSDTLVFTGKQEDSIRINAGESQTVYFDVQAPEHIKAGEHLFTFTASSDSFVDSVEQVIPITPNTTYETVATANFTKDNKATEYLYVPNEVISGEGGLTINANATMAVFMTDALSYMATYPYGCSEQLASSLSTIGTLTNALTIPNVEGDFETIEYEGVTYTVDTVVADGLQQIYEAQTLEGGFAYYKGLQPNLPLTMHVLTALSDVREAGFEVKEDVLRRAAAYVETEAKRVYTLSPASNKETIILAEYALRQNGMTNTQLTDIVVTLINDKAFLNEHISSMTLAYLSILTANNFENSSKSLVYDALKNRIDIDGRGAYLTPGKNENYSYFETPIKNTALLLKAFAAHEDEDPTLGNVLRWLLASRDNKGVWGGTHNTFVVVDSMIDYLQWQHETESHFTLRGLLDGVELFGFEFNPSSIFKTVTHFVSIDDLPREKLIPFVFERENHGTRENNLYYDMALKYFVPVESLPPRDEGITITRGLFALEDSKEKEELTKVSVGEIVRGKLTLTIPDAYTHVAIEDIIPAGFEIVNFNLSTEDQSLLQEGVYDKYSSSEPESIWSQLGNFFGASQTAQVFRSQGFGGSYKVDTQTLYPTHTESHDDRVFLYVEELGEGVYEYEYFLRALVPGTFQHLPARAEELFFPEVFGRTTGSTITITPSE